MATNCCLSCARIALAILSFIILLVGVCFDCLLILFYLDQHIEQQMRITLLNDQSGTTVNEIYQIKQQFRVSYLIGFWALVVFGAMLFVIGFFGLCASGCGAMGRRISAFLSTLLVFLVSAEVVIIALIFLYKNMIIEKANNYLSLSFQYNLQDAQVIRNRFNCCGDGTANSYNYQCQSIAQPNCRQLLDDGLTMILFGTIVFIGGLICFQMLILLCSCLVICFNKYRTMNGTA